MRQIALSIFLIVIIAKFKKAGEREAVTIEGRGHHFASLETQAIASVAAVVFACSTVSVAYLSLGHQTTPHIVCSASLTMPEATHEGVSGIDLFKMMMQTI